MAEVRTIAVIGAGPLGRSIACQAALGGYRTILENILPSSLRKAESEIADYLNQGAEQRRVSPADAGSAFRRLEYAGTVETAAREADLVIETVPDEMESKLEIFILLDKISRPHTILCSTASSIGVTELASVTYRAKKILGLNFSLAVSSNGSGRLDVIRGQETDADTVAACSEVGRRMGLEVVVREAISD